MEPRSIRPHLERVLTTQYLGTALELIFQSDPPKPQPTGKTIRMQGGAPATRTLRDLPVLTRLNRDPAPGGEVKPPYRYAITRDLEELEEHSLNVAILTGLPSGNQVYVDGDLVAIGNFSGRAYIKAGRLTILDWDGDLVTAGFVERRKTYRVGDPVLVRSITPLEIPRPRQAATTALDFISNDGEDRIILERLKNRSYVIHRQRWYQADRDGYVTLHNIGIGPQELLVVDQHGVPYAHSHTAKAGDTFRARFQYSSGFGHYGYYSGKTYEVQINLFDAFDTSSVLDTQTLFRVRRFVGVDTVGSDGTTYTSMSPRPVEDLITLEAMAEWAFVTFTGREEITLSSKPSQPYSGVVTDAAVLSSTFTYQNNHKKADDQLTLRDEHSIYGTFTVWAEDTFAYYSKPSQPYSGTVTDGAILESSYEYYDTRKKAFDLFEAVTFNNRPAHWIVLDVIEYSLWAHAARTKIFGDDLITNTLERSSLWRNIRRNDKALVRDEAVDGEPGKAYRNLAKKGTELFQVLVERVESTIGKTAYEHIWTEDHVRQILEKIYESDNAFLRDTGNMARAAFLATEAWRLHDTTITVRDRFIYDLIFSRSRLVLNALGNPHAFLANHQLKLLEHGQYLPSETVFGDLTLRQGSTRLRDAINNNLNHLPEDEGPEVLNEEAYEGAFSEWGSLQNASTRRHDIFELLDGSILSRPVFASDRITLGATATVPDVSTYFSTATLKTTRLEPMVYRPEVRSIMQRDTGAMLFYINKDDELIRISADSTGRWKGQPEKVLKPFTGTRYLDVAPGATDDTAYIVAQQSNNNSVLYEWTRAGGDDGEGTMRLIRTIGSAQAPTVASTYPDTPYGHVVVAYQRAGQPRRVYWEVVTSHPDAVAFPHGNSGNVLFSHNVRLDQFENSQGQMTIICRNLELPDDRTLFYRLGTVLHDDARISEKAPTVAVAGTPQAVRLTLQEKIATSLDVHHDNRLVPHQPPAVHEAVRENISHTWGSSISRTVARPLLETFNEEPSVPAARTTSKNSLVLTQEHLHENLSWSARSTSRNIYRELQESLNESIDFPGGTYERRP